MKTLTRICPCGEKFTRKKYEIERVEKRGGTPYCSRSCTASFINIGRPTTLAMSEAAKQNVKKASETHKISYPGLSRLLNYCRRRKDKGECDLTKEYLIQLWEQQGGKCTYIGNQLVLPNSKGIKEDPRMLASIDRIDPNIGYIQGNVQFISACMNYMKHQMSHEETLEYLDLIRS